MCVYVWRKKKRNRWKVKAVGQSSFVYIYIIGKTCRCVTNGRIAKERKKLIRAQLSTTLFVTLRCKQLDVKMKVIEVKFFVIKDQSKKVSNMSHQVYETMNFLAYRFVDRGWICT